MHNLGPGLRGNSGKSNQTKSSNSAGSCEVGGAQAECGCMLSRRAARSVTQLYDVVLAPIAMRATQFVLLHAITEAGQVAQWQLSKQLSIAVETLTRRLATMRRLGWIELRSGSDKREHLYSSTELGREQLERAMPYWYRAQERLKEQLGEEGWNQAVATLDRLALAAERSLTARMKNVAPKPELSE